MNTCGCRLDLSGEHDPNCPLNSKGAVQVITPKELETEAWICPECGGMENLSPLMSVPSHRHGDGGTGGGWGLVLLHKLSEKAKKEKAA